MSKTKRRYRIRYQYLRGGSDWTTIEVDAVDGLQAEHFVLSGYDSDGTRLELEAEVNIQLIDDFGPVEEIAETTASHKSNRQGA